MEEDWLVVKSSTKKINTKNRFVKPKLKIKAADYPILQTAQLLKLKNSFSLTSQTQQKITPKLDLHGFSENQAYILLEEFIKFSACKGFKSVEVITGKGSKKFGTGIIKQNISRWLSLTKISLYITSFDELEASVFIRLRSGF